MLIRRLAAGSLSGLLLCAGGVLAAGSAAAAPLPSVPAAAYPPVSSAVGVSTTDIRVGEVITVTANGFKPLSAATVTTSAGGVLGTGRGPGSVAMVGDGFQVYPATADASGVVTASVKFDEAGVHTVTISGIDAVGAPRSVSSEFTVAEAAAPVSGPAVTTPRVVPGADEETSSNLLEYGALGVGVVVLVGLGLVSLRMRSARKSAPGPRKPMPPTGPVVPVTAPAMAAGLAAPMPGLVGVPGQPGSAVYPAGHPSTYPAPAPVPAPTPTYQPQS